MTGILCALAIGGHRIADTAADLEDHQVTALDGLQVRWGRSSRLDQPGAATMTATLALPTGTAAVAALDALQPGATVEVTSEYTAPPADTTVIPSTPTETLTAPAPATAPLVRTWPPGTLAPEGTAPASWDALPRIGYASTLTATATLTLPPRTTATLHPVYYTGPWASAATLGPALATLTASGTMRADITPTIDHVGQWVGLAVRVWPIGPTWKDQTAAWTGYPVTWQSYAQATTRAVSLTRRDSLLYQATAFTGRITDAPVKWDDTLHRPVATVTAAEFPAEMANMRVGDEPWPSETAAQRIARIVTLTGLPVRTVIDPDPGAVILGARDVDSRDPSSLLQDVATSTGAILWPATHATLGPYLRLEDPDQRRALYRLVIPTTGPVTIEPVAGAATELSARTVHRDGVEVVRDTTDLASVVAVRWAETTTSGTGEVTTTERTTTLTDPDRLATYGHRSISLGTELTTATAAHQLATRTLARSAPGGWSIPEATWDTDLPGSSPEAVLMAVDATRRLGLPLMLTDVDDWVPGAPRIPVYLDNGTYHYRGGRWVLDLTLTRAAVPAAALTWQDLPPAITWPRFSALTWADLSSVTL